MYLLWCSPDRDLPPQQGLGLSLFKGVGSVVEQIRAGLSMRQGEAVASDSFLCHCSLLFCHPLLAASSTHMGPWPPPPLLLTKKVARHGGGGNVCVCSGSSCSGKGTAFSVLTETAKRPGLALECNAFHS